MRLRSSLRLDHYDLPFSTATATAVLCHSYFAEPAPTPRCRRRRRDRDPHPGGEQEPQERVAAHSALTPLALSVRRRFPGMEGLTGLRHPSLAETLRIWGPAGRGRIGLLFGCVKDCGRCRGEILCLPNPWCIEYTGEVEGDSGGVDLVMLWISADAEGLAKWSVRCVRSRSTEYTEVVNSTLCSLF